MRTEKVTRRRKKAARSGGSAQRSTLHVALSGEEADAGALKHRLEAAISGDRRVEIDAGAVTVLATAAVQVLLAAAASAEARQMEFRLKQCSQAVTAAFGELGLADKIASWMTPTPNSGVAEA